MLTVRKKDQNIIIARIIDDFYFLLFICII